MENRMCFLFVHIYHALTIWLELLSASVLIEFCVSFLSLRLRLNMFFLYVFYICLSGDGVLSTLFLAENIDVRKRKVLHLWNFEFFSFCSLHEQNIMLHKFLTFNLHDSCHCRLIVERQLWNNICCKAEFLNRY